MQWTKSVNDTNGTKNGLNNKLRTYKEFKNKFQTEAYLKKPMSYNVRKTFSNFRCGNAPLHIETGRYKNISLENRKCEICRSDNI